MTRKISINSDLSLTAIEHQDQQILLSLMQKIYLDAYPHLWMDDGSFYFNTFYSQENLKNELSDKNAHYFFVYFKKEQIGIFRYVLNCNYKNDQTKSVKLHRIYLDQSVHGKGIGSRLIEWLEKEIRSDYDCLWLESMDTQENAINFYKKLSFEIVGATSLTFDLVNPGFQGMHIMAKSLANT